MRLETAAERAVQTDLPERARRRRLTTSCLVRALAELDDGDPVLAAVWAVMATLHATELAGPEEVQRTIERALARAKTEAESS